MVIAGPNLYRLVYTLDYVKDMEFTRLVVAYSEKEAAAHIGSGVKSISLIEREISLCVPEQYLNQGKR